MSEHTFTNWLQFEVNSARCALLKLIEKEDRMRYIEGPELERAYMEAVGHYEESVVKEEMECELLTTKQRLIQAAINRREPIDEAAIDEKIAALRQDMMVSAAGEGEPKAYAELSPVRPDRRSVSSQHAPRNDAGAQSAVRKGAGRLSPQGSAGAPVDLGDVDGFG